MAILSVIFGYLCISFFDQLSEWFDLEAKIGSFALVKQIAGVFLGLLLFMIINANKKAMSHMSEVYGELQKVIWPEKNTVLKLTIGIIIAVSIVSSIFVFLDFIFQKLLELTY
jgi:preprotein translocase subunit SecE